MAPASQQRDGEKLNLLIVEDSFLAARTLVRIVESAGASVLGPAPTVAAAMRLLDSSPCHGAILDVNLGDESVEPVAARLEQDGCPFFFLTGYASPVSLGPGFRGRLLLHKPVDATELVEAIRREFARPGPPGDALPPPT
jgi:DNA-binding response OmpR family regulator